MTDVLILGAGYAGIRAAKTLSKFAPQNTTITLVDKNTIHAEKTQLHEVAAGTMPADKITFDIRSILPKSVNFVQAEVKKVNVDAKTVDFVDHDTIAYDYVVVALGFRSESFGLPGADENALPLEDIPSAEKIFETIEAHVANYAKSQDRKDLSIIVAGAGFTGIELLGELTHTVPKLQAKYNTPDIQVTSMEMATRILPMFDESLANYAMEYLQDHGINMMTGTKITKIEPNAVVYGDGESEKRVYGNTIIWTVGVSGSDVIAESGFEQRRNRVVVTDKLNLKEHPEVFIVGDVSAAMDPSSNRPYPTTAQISTREGNLAAKNIASAIQGGALEPFTYESIGTVASLGGADGIAQVGAKQRKYKGFMAKVLKRAVVDKSLFEDANLSTMFKKGRWPL
ncbi:NAD(P)/FAD-dependent oxidoreductase [Lactobacillus sp. CC-MHH1034]|uniref:NAD(P)/FAD-dependent oxidoreductase n=1 Tax=Agrilactobacillus fermenti TaxID=2586909 RepID=UPI001E379BCC|nr:NAD(P)/FAD-dependent oxidoreductase [Agrilactobacillus fermenti]MCD2255866.1 NAD(P)/FAD-dependent oxidoreductase [Agrilactobacillus fermenti]